MLVLGDKLRSGDPAAVVAALARAVRSVWVRQRQRATINNTNSIGSTQGQRAGIYNYNTYG